MRIVSILVLLLISVFLFCEDLEREFLQAQAKIAEDEMIGSFLNLATEHPDSYYGQRAYLELAKIHLLKRDYRQADEYLSKITDPQISDKEYWQAKVYLHLQDYGKAIISAQNYIFASENPEKIEVAYFIIAEAYIHQKMVQRALNTIFALRDSQYINNHIPLMHFKIGYCYETMGEYDQALSSYRKLRQEFPYHQYTYNAEDRVYELIRAQKIELHEFGSTESRDIEYAERLYLQVGAFGSSDNARQYSQRLKSMGFSSIVFPKTQDGKTLHVVAVGPFVDDNDLNNAKNELEEKNIQSFRIMR